MMGKTQKRKSGKKRRIQGIAFCLTALLLIASMIWAMPAQGVEPENPMRTEADRLKVDIRTQSGDDEPEEEEPEEEEPEEEEPEEEEPEEEEPEEEEEPDQKQPEGEATAGEAQDESEDLPPEAGNNAEGGGQGDTGQHSDDVPGEDETGKLPAENGEENMDDPGTGQAPGEEEQGLVTDLYSRVITFSELENDTIQFYAYYSDASVDANIKVNYKHSSDQGNGTWLTVKGEHDYEAVLKLGKNVITIFYTDETGTRNWARVTLTYQADKATAEQPEIGAHPPVIETNLDGWDGDIKIDEFTFTVSAKTWKGERIYSDCIQVRLDGELVMYPTGSGVYEYVLYFERPNVGDYSNHTVSVLAWDEEGNSRYVEYDIRYHAHDEGLDLGTVHVVIDATTVECGIIDECDIDVKSGDSAAKAVLAALEEYGYSCKYTGTPEKDFYLSSISRANAFRGAHIGERLRRLIERDGITFLASGTRDSLGEYDYTRGSGWMYFINGELCPGKAMSSWKLNGGETISLRFTLAYGKDLGVYSYSSGSLSSYCAKWINGQVIELGHNYQETSRVEAGADTDGYIEYTCSKCGETKQEILPATGGESENPDPSGGEEGNPSGGGGENPGPSGGEEENPSGGEEENPSGGEEENPSGGEEENPSGGEEENPSGGEEENPSGGGDESPDPPDTGETENPETPEEGDGT